MSAVAKDRQSNTRRIAIALALGLTLGLSVGAIWGNERGKVAGKAEAFDDFVRNHSYDIMLAGCSLANTSKKFDANRSLENAQYLLAAIEKAGQVLDMPQPDEFDYGYASAKLLSSGLWLHGFDDVAERIEKYRLAASNLHRAAESASQALALFDGNRPDHGSAFAQVMFRATDVIDTTGVLSGTSPESVRCFG